jgi:glycosyltransferase involved in cell wall biosynthesis
LTNRGLGDLAKHTNVLCIVSSLCVGGAEKHAISLVNRLDPAAFKVHLCYLKPVEALLSQVRPEALSRTFCLNVETRFDRSAMYRLRDFIDANNIQVLVATNEYPMLYAICVRSRCQIAPKVIEVFHTTVFDRLKSRLQMLFYRPLFKRCDLLVYVSEKQREYWRRAGLRARRDIVIHNGVDLNRFRGFKDAEGQPDVRTQCGYASDDYVIAICATMRPEKAHADLLEALVKLRDRGIMAKALFIGDGPERATIERRCAELKLERSVHITGFQQDVRPFLAISDVVALTSHTIETFSIAALEAMAMGKPLVLSRIGGAEEQAVEGVNGYVFEPGDISTLTDRLAALQPVAVRERMGRASRLRVEELFSEDRMLEQFQCQIQSLAPRTVDRFT